MKIFPVKALILTAFLLPSASAEDIQPQGNPCKKEYTAYCAKIPKFWDRIICLRSRKKDLSDPCAAIVEKVYSANEKARAACKKDAVKLCGIVGMQAFPCLMQKESLLSEVCAKNLEAMRRLMPKHIRENFEKLRHKQKEEKKPQGTAQEEKKTSPPERDRREP